jgi:hypothetical protein
VADDAGVVLGRAVVVAETELLQGEDLAAAAREPVRRGAADAAAADDDEADAPGHGRRTLPAGGRGRAGGARTR